MINELIKLITSQEGELRKLLDLLETQYKMIMSKDVFGLEGLVDKINVCGKKIAEEEVKRRKLLGDNDNISEIINKSNNDELKNHYNTIKDTLSAVLSQKETNDMLLKQQIVFNNKMLEFINPGREIKTYNAYGSLSK